VHIVIIDNFDSFTYNLVHLLEAEGAECKVMRNDDIDWLLIDACDGLVLGPGPGIPSEAGSLIQVIERYESHKPILGICLGHQALGEYFGGQMVNLQEVYHGVEMEIRWTEENALNRGLSIEMIVGLYHSWGVECSADAEWNVIASSPNGIVMGLRHRYKAIWGVQFHPESVMTPSGRRLLRNWLDSI
jgi:anthranilate synthase component II